MGRIISRIESALNSAEEAYAVPQHAAKAIILCPFIIVFLFSLFLALPIIRSTALLMTYGEHSPVELITFGFLIWGGVRGMVLARQARNQEEGILVFGFYAVFSVSSSSYELSLPEGRYRVRMSIDPNYLRAGTYSLILKMFADGVRQETLGDTLRFSINENKAYRDRDGQYQMWVSGPLRFDYEWGQIEPTPTVGYE